MQSTLLYAYLLVAIIAIGSMATVVICSDQEYIPEGTITTQK